MYIYRYNTTSVKNIHVILRLTIMKITYSKLRVSSCYRNNLQQKHKRSSFEYGLEVKTS